MIHASISREICKLAKIPIYLYSKLHPLLIYSFTITPLITPTSFTLLTPPTQHTSVRVYCLYTCIPSPTAPAGRPRLLTPSCVIPRRRAAATAAAADDASIARRALITRRNRAAAATPGRTAAGRRSR